MRATVLICVVYFLFGCSDRAAPPYSPSAAVDTFELHPDFEIELFVAEPEIADPVAIAFGPDGQIWVVENSGYPLDTQGRRGRIKLIEDTNGDGRPDKTTLFADRLTLPTGIMPWKDGVLVTDAPDVLYLADTDGDGRADLREKMLSGFAFTNPQHTVSSPAYGLDNWIYLSHEGYTRSTVFAADFGDTGSEIHFPGKQDGPRVPIARRSVRFRPESFELELLAGPSQYGLAFTKWGDVFTHNNSNHVRHEVIAARYLERNPHLRVQSTAHNVFAEPNPATVYPITVNPRFEILSGVGQMTSASGLTRYLGGAFSGYEDLAFVAESVHNVVHADRWAPSGSTFIAQRLREGKEFLASRDAWFRPVNFAIGPDGALYVVDYYRDVIEHPEWTSAETYTSDVLYDGDDRGRIWRITPDGGLPYVAPRLGDASSDELVSELTSANIWNRNTAQQLLVERRSTNPLPALEALVRDGLNPLGRLHALWTLEGIGALSDEVLGLALQSEEPGVRRNAVLLVEPRFRREPSRWERKLLALADDADAHVRLQLLLTLGEAPSAAAEKVRERLLLESLEDEWVQVAALTWPDTDATALLSRVSTNVRQSESGERFLEMVGSLTGSEPAAIGSLLNRTVSLKDEWRQAAVLRGLRASLEGRGAREAVPVAARDQILKLFTAGDSNVRLAALGLLAEVGVGGSTAARAAEAQAKKVAEDSGGDEHRRAEAIQLLSLADSEIYANLFRRLAHLSQPDAVQAAAVSAYGRSRSDEVSAFLLEHWSEFQGEARAAAGEALTADDARARLLVHALEAGSVQPWMLVFRQRRRLIMHRDSELRERARRALTAPDRDRAAIVERYRAAQAQRPGDASRGREVFERVCEKCHLLNGAGADVGPDLGTVRTRPAISILNDILLPNQSITQTYEAYVIETNDGRLLDGVIRLQSPTFITLRREGGEQDVIERSQIRSMRAAQLSAMPTDLETQITPRAMADLIRYIQSAPE